MPGFVLVHPLNPGCHLAREPVVEIAYFLASTILMP
jgi:hypothetical protein